MHYQWLLFDADGTLFDFERAEAAALESTFAQFDTDIEPHFIPAYHRVNKHLWRELEHDRIRPSELRVQRFSVLFDELRLNLEAESFSQTYLEELARRPDLIDGATEVLQNLASRYRCAIVTNGLQAVQRSRLAYSTIRDFISDIVVSEEVGAAKPDRAIFDSTFERIGYPPKSDVLMIGDSLTADIDGGRAYGLDTCWFNPNGCDSGDRSITFQISRLSELTKLL